MGRQGIEVRRDITAVVLRKKARLVRDVRVATRMLALANVLEGMDRDQAARSAGMTRQVLRDWVLRYNAEGLAGLSDRARGHKRRALSSAQEEALRALVLAGPAEGGRVRWRLVDLQGEIETRFGVSYHERTVGKILHRLGFARLSARPMHPAGDAAAQAAFKKTSGIIWNLPCPDTPGARRSRSGSRMKPASDRKARSPGSGVCAAAALA